MKQDEIRRAMIDGTIHVVARDGLDKATTKLLAAEAGVNEAYIYRFFDGKEDMLVKTFTTLDLELSGKILECMPAMANSNISIENRCWMLFSCVWNFLLCNSEKCLCFIRYYYSPYFIKYSSKEHKEMYQTVVEKIQPAFKEGADVWMLLNYILDVMLAYSIRVFNGELANDAKTAEYVYNLVYSGVESQLSWSKKS